jgi:hypothetical protein
MIGLAVTLVLAALPCTCPGSSQSREQVLVARSPDSDHGLIVCGYTEERDSEVVLASEFEVFSCERDKKPILALGATETARLRVTTLGLEVTEVSNWPVGEGWRWEPVPLYRWVLPFESSAPPLREIVLQPPVVTRAQLSELAVWYDRLLRASQDERAEQSEEAVARLFVAALAGDAAFQRLFRAMPGEFGLDGHAAEIYSEAEIILALHTEHRIRSAKN